MTLQPDITTVPDGLLGTKIFTILIVPKKGLPLVPCWYIDIAEMSPTICGSQSALPVFVMKKLVSLRESKNSIFEYIAVENTFTALEW